MVGSDTELYRYFMEWRPGDVAVSQNRGSQIVKAIDAFKSDHGVYPIGLYELTPRYLREIPYPVNGERFWRYETNRAGGVFSLSFAFDLNQYPVCVYSSEDRTWKENS